MEKISDSIKKDFNEMSDSVKKSLLDMDVTTQ